MDLNSKNEKIVQSIAVYARVSTSRQEEDGTIETQLLAIRDYAKQNGYTIVKEYIDDGWSGDVLARPNLDQLRNDAKSEHRTWDGILMYDPDRLARRYSYQELVMDEFKEAGVEMMFVTVSTPKNAEDKILHGVRGLFAEYERAKITERFRLGKLRSIKEGNILASRPLYGYDRTKREGKSPGKYVVNEAEATVVKRIFTWVADEGLTIRQVVRRLQALAIPPRRSKRGVWNTSTLTTTLRNEAYVGRAHWYSTVSVVPKRPLSERMYRKVTKSSTRPLPRDKWMYVPVPAILDEDLFNRARQRLAEHARLNPRNTKYEYLLGGKIRCVCGQRRIGASRQRGKYLYYDCCDKILCFPLPRKCHENPVNALRADELVWREIAGLMGSPERLAAQAARWMARREAKAKSAVANIDTTKRQIDALRQQEERYNQAYGAGLYSLEELKGRLAPIRAQVTALELEMAQAGQKAGQIEIEKMPDHDEIQRFARKVLLELPYLSFDKKRAIVLNVVEKIVATQQQIRVYGYIPVTTYGGQKTKDRHSPSVTNNPVQLEVGKGVPFALTIEVPSSNRGTVKRQAIESHERP